MSTTTRNSSLCRGSSNLDLNSSPRPALRQHQRRAGSSCSTASREAITGSRSASMGRCTTLMRSVTSTTFVTRSQRLATCRWAGCFTRPIGCPPAWRGAISPPTCSATRCTGTRSRRLGSTFQARQVGDLVRANDTWFAPSDQALGPDGALYVADWHDRRTAHPDPDADWDRTNGRIFAVTARGAKPAAAARRAT